MCSSHEKVLDKVVSPSNSEISSVRRQWDIHKPVVCIHTHTHRHNLSHNTSKCCVNMQGESLGECSNCQHSLAEVWSHETKWVRFTASHTQADGRAGCFSWIISFLPQLLDIRVTPNTVKINRQIILKMLDGLQSTVSRFWSSLRNVDRDCVSTPVCLAFVGK